MAGGEGTRLRPVSINEPKPMARLIDRPAIEYIIELLEKNGVTDACLTLKYMPQIITDYISEHEFGVNLQTRVEHEALGTAGSVKSCADFIGGDDFLVISGDCLCDFDLRALMDFHKSKNAEATLALFKHPEPLEYGLVVTHEDGRIAEFIEKPPWEGVVTNSINTGIYILSPSVLGKIPTDRPYDFGKELFPLMLREQCRLYGIAMDGYWCDIGSPEAYRQCSIDMLEGLVDIDIYAERHGAGVWSKSIIPTGVTVTPPVYIGSNVKLQPGASIGPRAVIGEGSAVAGGASVSDSIINGASIQNGAVIDGAVICKSAIIGRGVRVHPGAVIGEGCTVCESSVISESVKIWPDRHIPESTLMKSSITHGFTRGDMSFTSRGVISGLFGTELSVSDCLRLGQAAAGFGRVGLGCAGSDTARILAEAIGCGICSASGELLRFDSGLSSCASFFGMSMGLPLTICVGQELDKLNITFFGKDGGLLPHNMERKIVSFQDSDLPRGFSDIGRAETITGTFETYAASAARYARRDSDCNGLDVSVIGPGAQNRALRRALELLGCNVVRQSETCLKVRHGGMELLAEDKDTRRFSPEQMLALVCALEIERGRREIAVPFDAPSVIDAIAARRNVMVYRLGRDGEQAETLYTRLRVLRDAVFGGALVCVWMKKLGMSLSELVDSKVPRFTVIEREVPLKRGRGEVMGELSAAACEAGAEFADGIKLRNTDGSVLISPLRNSNAIRIRAEAESVEIAEELCSDIVESLRDRL